MLGHQSCNRAVITHLSQHFPDAMFPSQVWSTMLRWSTQVRTRQDMSCQNWVSQSEDKLRQSDQWEAWIHRAALESGMMYSDSVTVPGAGPNKWGPPRAPSSILTTFRQGPDTVSFQQCSCLSRAGPLLVSRANQRVGVLWRTNDQKKSTIDFLSEVFMRCNWSKAFYNRPRLIPNAMPPWPGAGRSSGSALAKNIWQIKRRQEVQRFHLNWLKYLWGQHLWASLDDKTLFRMC